MNNYTAKLIIIVYSCVIFAVSLILFIGDYYQLHRRVESIERVIEIIPTLQNNLAKENHEHIFTNNSQ